VKIIVDTNIVFSAILNSSGKIGKILLNAKDHFQFYSCDFLRVEITKHKDRLLQLTKLSEKELSELENLVTGNITFINEGLIPSEIIKSTEAILLHIDPNDTPFVALAQHLKATLWTGDLKLIRGLKAKKFKQVISTAELSLLMDELEE
jgi:predicted nucleic acid-binding protein